MQQLSNVLTVGDSNHLNPFLKPLNISHENKQDEVDRNSMTKNFLIFHTTPAIINGVTRMLEHIDKTYTQHFRKETNMFKLGDAVTLKNLSEVEIEKYPYYHQVILKYDGQSGELLKIAEYDMLVKFSDGFICWWPKEWVVSATQYNAF